MKLFGGSKKNNGKHRPDEHGHNERAGGGSPTQDKTPSERAEIERIVAEYQRKKRRRHVIALVVILMLAAGGTAAWAIWVRPPDISGNDGPTLASETAEAGETTDGPEPSPAPSEEVYEPGKRHKYSFVIIGEDKEAVLTDTMIVGMFDVENHKLNIVNIPRDTLVNVSWGIKKANTMYRDGGGIESFTGVYLRDLLGFEVDLWAVVNLDAFVQLVDSIGGVYYDVPFDMIYEDYVQDLDISIYAGYQHLSGAEAIKVFRWRQGVDSSGEKTFYPDGDIGRITTQQDFLKSVAAQVLRIGNVTKINDFVKIFEENVQTNLTAGNVVYLAQEYLKLSPEDITFQIMPGNYYCSILNRSYCSIYLDDWIEMINGYLNPYDEPVTVEHLNILRWDSLSGAYSTTGVVAGGPDSFS